jgi:hypothetical protein
MRIKDVLVTLALAGCMDRPIASVYPVQGKVETKDLPSNPEKDVDVLFLIDNSGSMAAEQASLQANFPKFMQVLETLESGAPNIAGVGTAGCGIEQHLAGVERALQNPANAGFLRPEAKLAVVVIADEDDCSLAHHDLFQTGVDGPSLNFRCTKSGIVCRDNPDLAQPGVRTDCEPQDESRYLEPVARYADFLKSLKPTWRDDVLVAGIVGDSSPFEIVLDGMQRPVLGQSCRYGNGDGAFPALRTADFLTQFPQTVQKTICGADLSAAMVEIAAKLKRSFGDACWEGEVADLDPVTPGLQPDCSVTDVQVLPDGSTKEIDQIPNCSFGQIPCWKLVEDARQCFYTSTHTKLVIDRGGVIPPSDVHVKASCVTTDPGGDGFM